MGTFLRRHWSAAAGIAVAIVPHAWQALRFVLDMAGYTDLVVSHVESGKPTWVSAMKELLLQPPGWVQVFLLIAGLGLIWWDVKRRPPVSTKPKVATPTQIPAPAASPAGPPSFKELWDERKAMETGSYSEAWEKPLDFGVLFEVIDGKQIKLRFPPDSNKSEDALALALFGYKKFCGLNRVPFQIATEAMRSCGKHMPWGQATEVMTIFGETSLDVAKNRLSHVVNIVDLAKGGTLEITPQGYRSAYELAKDLISRA